MTPIPLTPRRVRTSAATRLISMFFPKSLDRREILDCFASAGQEEIGRRFLEASEDGWASRRGSFLLVTSGI